MFLLIQIEAKNPKMGRTSLCESLAKISLFPKSTFKFRHDLAKALTAFGQGEVNCCLALITVS